MIIAIPLTAAGACAPHFGESTQVGLYAVEATGAVMRSAVLVPPTSEPCGWAPWLRAQGVNVVFAGGIGAGAQTRLETEGIEVVAGFPPSDPKEILKAFLHGGLVLGANSCEDHGGHHHHHHDGAGHDHGECGCAH